MKKQIKILLILGLFFLSFGGGWMHFAYHPAAKTGYGWVPFIAGLVSVLLIPLLFAFKKTVHWAYLLNGFAVVIGTITMVQFSIEVHPIWADVAILWGKFVLGRALFCLEVYPLEAAPRAKGLAFFRYPNLGFWYVHLVMWAIVYFLGHKLWG
jgi:hypothetical protein